MSRCHHSVTLTPIILGVAEQNGLKKNSEHQCKKALFKLFCLGLAPLGGPRGAFFCKAQTKQNGDFFIEGAHVELNFHSFFVKKIKFRQFLIVWQAHFFIVLVTGIVLQKLSGET